MRNSPRALAVAAGTLCVLPLVATLAGPALADSVPTTAYDAGPGLTVSETLGLFVGIPALVIGVVYALVYALTGRRGPRYPAGGPWTAGDEWFGDRPGADAHSGGAVGQNVASDSARPDAAVPSEGEGGARGRW